MLIEEKNAFDNDFFQAFSSDEKERKILQTMLQPEHSFSKSNSWQAILIKDDNQKVCGRIFISGHQKHSFFFFGYFLADKLETSQTLLNKAWEWGQSQGFSEMRGPVQAHVFNGSRIITKKKQDIEIPGEPSYPAHYNEYFLKSGLKQDRFWKSLVIPRIYLYIQFFTGYWCYRRHYKDIKVIESDFQNPEHSSRFFKMLYELVHDSFSSLPDFTDFTYEEFLLWSSPSLSLMDSRYCLIALYQDRPVAFLLSKKWQNEFCILYLGKKKETEGKIKGITAPLFAKLLRDSWGFVKKPPLLCYISNESPTYKVLPKHGVREVAEYVLYNKT